MAITLVVLAVIHRGIKLSLGYTDSPQTMLGSFALIGFIVLMLAALILFAPIFPAKTPLIKKLRTWLKDRFKIDYPRMRALHALIIALVLVAAIHIGLATSSLNSPAGSLWLAFFLLVALTFYIRYRLRNRGNPKKVR
jgi:hypothetical protein